MERTKAEIVESIKRLKNAQFLSNIQNHLQDAYSEDNAQTFDKEPHFPKLIQILSHYSDKGILMNEEKLNETLKEVIEPILLDWVRENMPRICKEVVKQALEKNKQLLK